MEEHRNFDTAVDEYVLWNNGPYSHTKHVERVRDVVTEGQRLLHALGAEPAHYKLIAPTNDVLVEAAIWALCHFESMDTANAAIHCAPVRYSPITFRLARGLRECGVDNDTVDEVTEHDGAYEEDPGR